MCVVAFAGLDRPFLLQVKIRGHTTTNHANSYLETAKTKPNSVLLGQISVLADHRSIKRFGDGGTFARRGADKIKTFWAVRTKAKSRLALKLTNSVEHAHKVNSQKEHGNPSPGGLGSQLGAHRKVGSQIICARHLSNSSKRSARHTAPKSPL
jgi:hypothetical protein